MAYENDNYDQGSVPGMIASSAWGMAKWSYSWESLKMLQDAPRLGYSLPWTRGIGRATGIRAARHGINFGGRIKQAGLRSMYEEAGLLGFTGARRAAVRTFGVQAASSAGSKYLISRAAGFVASPYLIAAMFAWDVAGAGITAYRAISQQISKYRGLELGGYFPETQGAATSRQRALQAITASQLQARSAIGNEAMLFHR